MNTYEYHMYLQARENHRASKPCPFCIEATQEAFWRETGEKVRTRNHNNMCSKCPHATHTHFFYASLSCVTLGKQTLEFYEQHIERI